MMYPEEDYTFDGESVTEIPMAQRGKNIPTTADSLKLYNAQLALNNFYNKEVKANRLKKRYNVPYEAYGEEEGLTPRNLDFYREEIADRNRHKRGTYDEKYKEYFNLSPEQVRNLEYQGLAVTKASTPNVEYYRDLITPMQNLASPFAMVDKRIKPQRVIGYEPVGETIQYPGGAVTVYDYDPLAVKPYNMRTPQEKLEWEKRYGKPKKEKPDQFGLTREDYITARKNKYTPTPGNRKGDGYYELKKDGKTYKVYQQSGGNSWVDVPQQKPKPKPVVKPEPVKEQPIKKQEQPEKEVKKQEPITPAKKIEEPVVEKKPYRVDYSGGSKYFSSSAEGEQFMKQLNRDFLANKITNPGNVSGYYELEKKKSGGELKQIEKLDQSLNFTNYNKPTKGGWLNKYQ